MYLPLDTTFTVTFDKSLDSSSPGTITVNSPALVFADGVNGSIDFSTTTVENDTVTLTPNQPLLLNTTYRGVSVEGFSSAEGAEMSTPETLDWEISTLNYFFFGGMPTGTADVELYRTDGTGAGTVLVKEINPDGDSWPQFIAQEGNKAFFSARYDAAGAEGLFVTDGTEAGTVPVKEGIGFYYDPAGEVMNGILFFAASTSAEGNEVWISDGTTAGTQLLKDIRAGTSSSSPEYFTEYNNEIYFSAYDGTNYYLWRSDGTAAGTEKVSPAFIIRDRMAVMGDVLYLSGHPEGSDEIEELYAYDGSSYTQVSDDTDYNPMDPEKPATVGNKLFFTYNFSDELFVSDGTTVGTVSIVGGENSFYTLFGYGDILLYEGNAGSDTELWKSDGTGPGTMLVKDINPGSDFSSYPNYFRIINGIVIFSAFTESEGTELWKTDGTGAGTEIITDFNIGTEDGVYMTEPG